MIADHDCPDGPKTYTDHKHKTGYNKQYSVCMSMFLLVPSALCMQLVDGHVVLVPWHDIMLSIIFAGIYFQLGKVADV